MHGQLAPHQVLLGWAGEVQVLGLGIPASLSVKAGRLSIPADMHSLVAPEIHAGAPPSLRSDVYAAAAMVWSLLTAKQLPVVDAERKPLATLCAGLPAHVGKAIDEALEPSPARRSIPSRELCKILERGADSDGEREFRWSMEVYRALATVDNTLRPLESLAPGPPDQQVRILDALPLPVALLSARDKPPRLAETSPRARRRATRRLSRRRS